MKTRISFRYILIAVVVACISLPVVAQTSPKRLKVGLVLGGGGAKGAAEVGVLKVIERAGIPIDFIAGTSIGSIVGGLYSTGWRAESLDSMFRSQEWISLLTDRDDASRGKIFSEKDGVTYVFGFPISRQGSAKADPSFGIMRGDKVVELLQRMTNQTDSISFDALPIPFRCVAADINKQEEVVISGGHLPTAMRASMAIPGVFKPVKMHGHVLFDGGMMNNLPVDVVKNMGADVVIAVDLTQNKHDTRDFSLKETLGIGGLLDWAISRPDWEKYNDNLEMVDVYINPDLEGFSASSFNKDAILQMMTIGERAAEAQKGELEKLKQQIYR